MRSISEENNLSKSIKDYDYSGFNHGEGGLVTASPTRFACFDLIRSVARAFAPFWQCCRLINCGAFGRMVIFRTAT
jgi:hypothetical protein